MKRHAKLLGVFLLTLLIPGLSLASARDDARVMQVRAESAISAAERVDAERLATPALQDARALFARGQGSLEERDYRDAAREFERAAADARLAEARARQQASEQSTEELRAAVEALRDEIRKLETDA